LSDTPSTEAIPRPTVTFRGVGASAGFATGKLVICADDAENAAGGAAVVYFCTETSAEDVPAVKACVALVTTRGGLTGDGAIVARALGKPCVIGLPDLIIDRSAGCVRDKSGNVFPIGATVSVNGRAGTVEFATA
jgi:pyruvate, orthophosphate dikinase